MKVIGAKPTRKGITIEELKVGDIFTGSFEQGEYDYFLWLGDNTAFDLLRKIKRTILVTPAYCILFPEAKLILENGTELTSKVGKPLLT